MTPLSEARRQAEEALAAYDRCKGYEAYTYAFDCVRPLRALLAALPAEPAPPMDDDIEHPCGCYAPDGDRCWRHAKPPRPAQDAVREAAEMLRATDVEWVVNSLAELGVKIGEQFFFLYKGESLVYKRDDHEPGEPPLMWRYVGKREFGECCHPINDADPTRYGTVDVADGREWRPLLAAIDGRKP